MAGDFSNAKPFDPDGGGTSTSPALPEAVAPSATAADDRFPDAKPFDPDGGETSEAPESTGTEEPGFFSDALDTVVSGAEGLADMVTSPIESFKGPEGAEKPQEVVPFLREQMQTQVDQLLEDDSPQNIAAAVQLQAQRGGAIDQLAFGQSFTLEDINQETGEHVLATQLRELIPGVKFEKGDSNNIVAVVPPSAENPKGKRITFNAPGFSKADAGKLAAGLGVGIPAAVLAAFLTPAGIVPGMIAAGVVNTAATLGQNEIAKAAGADPELRPGQLAGQAALGAAIDLPIGGLAGTLRKSKPGKSTTRFLQGNKQKAPKTAKEASPEVQEAADILNDVDGVEEMLSGKVEATPQDIIDTVGTLELVPHVRENFFDLSEADQAKVMAVMDEGATEATEARAKSLVESIRKRNRRKGRRENPSKDLKRKRLKARRKAGRATQIVAAAGGFSSGGVLGAGIGAATGKIPGQLGMGAAQGLGRAISPSRSATDTVKRTRFDPLGLGPALGGAATTRQRDKR